MRLFLAMGFATCICCTGCRPLDDWLNKRIDARFAPEKMRLEERIQSLEEENDSLKGQLKNFRSAVSLSERDPYRKAALDPASKTFERVDSELGFFVVAIDSIRATPDGCEVGLRIGNPMSFTVSDTMVHAKWGPRFKAFSAKEVRDFGQFVDLTRSNYQSPTDPNYYAEWDAWQKSLLVSESALPRPLPPGTWSEAVMRMTPCKADELGYLEVSLDSKLPSPRLLQ